jgi:hypothetical protein
LLGSVRVHRAGEDVVLLSCGEFTALSWISGFVVVGVPTAAGDAFRIILRKLFTLVRTDGLAVKGADYKTAA